MTEIISKLDSGDIVALCGMLLGAVAIIGGITVAVTKVVAAHYRRTQLDEMEATLKMEMIQRGMSAGEIKQVLESKMGTPRSSAVGELLASWMHEPKVFHKGATDANKP
jgi:hypothetical protein